MKTTLRADAELRKTLTVVLPVKTFNERTGRILQDLNLKVKIDGFRKGKIPPAVLKQRFGANAERDAGEQIVRETISEALRQENIEPAAPPEVRDLSHDAKNFSYTLAFEILPTIEMADFKTLKIEQAAAKISEADEKNEWENFRRQLGEFEKTEEKSKQGDRLTIDFDGFIDGKKYPQACAEDYHFILGQSKMVGDFEKALDGVAVGAEKELSVDFANDYPAENLRGKTVIFKIKIKIVERLKLPEMNDNLAQKLGHKNIAAMRLDLREKMQRMLDVSLRKYNQDMIFKALVDAHDFALPEHNVSAEAHALFERTQQDMKNQNQPIDKNLSPAVFVEEAKRRVKLGILVNHIVVREKFTVDEKNLDAQLKEIAQSYGNDADKVLRWYREDSSRLENVRSLVLERRVAEYVAKSANLQTVGKNFNEMVYGRA